MLSTPPPPPDHWEEEIEPTDSLAWPMAIATFLALVWWILHLFGCY